MAQPGNTQGDPEPARRPEPLRPRELLVRELGRAGTLTEQQLRASGTRAPTGIRKLLARPREIGQCAGGVAASQGELPARHGHHGVREARVPEAVAQLVERRLGLLELASRDERLPQNSGRHERRQRGELGPRARHQAGIRLGVRQVTHAMGALGQESVRRQQAQAGAPRTRHLQALGDPSRGVLVLVALDQRPQRDPGRRPQRRSVVGEQAAVERQPGRRERPFHRLRPLDPALGENREHDALGGRVAGQLRGKRLEPRVELVVVLHVELQPHDQRRFEAPSRVELGARVAELELRPRELEQLTTPTKVPQHAHQLGNQLVAQFSLGARSERRTQVDHGARRVGAERLRATELAEHFDAAVALGGSDNARARSDAAASGAPSSSAARAVPSN